MINKILVVCNEPPYPTIHGGRFDTWYRLLGFRELGLRIQLLYWYDIAPPANDHKGAMLEVVDSVIEIPRKMTVRDLLHYKYPPRMMSLDITRSKYDELFRKVKKFDPDCVWLDLWCGYLTARKLSCSLQVPLIYRSQNVEFQYFRQLYNDAAGKLKIKLFLNLIRMRKAELEIRTSSDFVYDISQTDNATWKKEAPSLKADVLLPTWLPPKSVTIGNGAVPDPDIDILFVGNLNNPSNVSGLKWFASNVLNLVETSMGKPRVAFAGSNPSEELLSLCEKYSIECIPNPENVLTCYKRAKVIINPQLEGSGISLKMVELLLILKPVVTTRIGVRGFPDEVIANFNIADRPEEFADSVIKCATGVTEIDGQLRKHHLDKYFGLEPLAKALEKIGKFVNVDKEGLNIKTRVD
jgi:hypothetical protein